METLQKNKFAVVTGGSTGIGYELAIQFAKNGYDLLVVAENDVLLESCEHLRGFGVSVFPVFADLSTQVGIDTVVEEVERVQRPVDALALNAGVGASGAFVGETRLEDELNVINVNIVSLVCLAKRLLPDMVARKEGRVLLTSSVASFAPGPFHAVYHASKSFVQSFGEAIRHELKDSGVTVTCLLPGATETPFFARANMLDTKVGQSKKDDAALVARQGFEALMEGADQVVAGSLKNKIQGVISKVLPDSVKARQTAPANEHLARGDEKAANAVDMLTQQHREAEALFARIEKATEPERPAIFQTLATKLLEHMIIEEDVFYPAAEEVQADLVAENRGEHEEFRAAIAQILSLEGADSEFLPLVHSLAVKIEAHVQEEEHGLFPACKERMDTSDLIALADEMRDMIVQVAAQGELWQRKHARPDAQAQPPLM